MKKKLSLIFIILSIFVLSIFFIKNDNDIHFTQEEIEWISKQDAIIYAANENAPPLRFIDEVDNQYKGVVVDYINQLSLEIGVDIQTVPMEWDEALLSLKEGSTQICDMFINKERSQYYLFTDPIYNLRTVLLTKSTEGINLSNINNLKIATEKGDYANNYLVENYPDAELIYTNNVEEGLELFINGDVDSVVGDEPIIAYLLNERNEYHNSNYSITILYQEEVVLGVSKNTPELVQILNKAIEQTKNKGQMEQIQQKWFGISTPLSADRFQSEVIRYIVIVSMITISIFVFIILNNLQLQRLVKKRTEELEYSRNELQGIFDGISDYMLVVDKNKNVLKLNKSFADYLGITKIDYSENKCSRYIEKFCSDCNKCLFDEALSNTNTINKEIMVDNQVYEMHLQHLKDVNDALLITIKNITLDKINRNRMLQTNKMIAVGQLAAGMAHEIRNPLGIIRTQSYLIRLCDKIDDSVMKSLDFIDSSIERASKIIDNILSFSRLSSNEKQTVDINQMVCKLIEMHNDAISKKNININVESNIKEKLVINSDSLEHIILNLISNSIDAMDNRGNLNIVTNVEATDLIIICQDTGSGIDESNINNIYNPFFTTKELGKGTGLGLFITYSEVEKLNGKIDVKSKVDEGTIFTVIIPIERKNN